LGLKNLYILKGLKVIALTTLPSTVPKSSPEIFFLATRAEKK
jgi:hypothetical protein